MIIGADEVGTGALAGPFCVCAVRAPEDWSLDGLNDSKKLSAKKRGEILLLLMKEASIQYLIIEKSNELIDQKGLGVCLKEAYIEVITGLLGPDDHAIIDGMVKLPFDQRVQSLIKADQKIPAVMAASIIAKEYRDDLMHKLHWKHTEYDWLNNVGYGTASHKYAIKKFGMTDLHRKSYKLKLS